LKISKSVISVESDNVLSQLFLSIGDEFQS